MSTSLRSIPMRLPTSAKTALFALTLLSQSCRKEVITNDHSLARTEQLEYDKLPHEIERFYFLPVHNAHDFQDTIWTYVDGENITASMPYLMDRKLLIPSFETKAASVVVEGVEQESGLTPQDFTHPVTYRTIGYNGSLKDYKVQLLNFTGLPVTKIVTRGGALIDSKDNYVDAKIIIDGAGSFPDFEGDMKIKGRGNSTWTLPKKPYKMKFDNKTSLFNEGADKEWVLLANYNDKVQLNTSAAFFLGDKSTLEWTPDAHFTELFLNDVYQGTYQLCESVKAGESRLNIPKDGFLLEVDQEERMEPGDVYFKTSRILVNIKEPAVTKNDAKYNYVTNFIANAENALYGPDFQDPLNGYSKYLDIPSFIDWYLINEISKNRDAVFYSSCYMNLTPAGKLKMGPLWDFDMAFGNNPETILKTPEGFYVKNSRWIARLFDDPAFVKQVANRFDHFKANEALLLAYISNQAAKMNWPAVANNKRWNTLSTGVWPNEPIIDIYKGEVAKMQTWIKTRMAWLDNEFSSMK